MHSLITNARKNIANWITMWFSRTRHVPTRREIGQTFGGFSPHEKYLFGLLIFVLAGSFFALTVQFFLINTKIIPADGGEYREAIIGFPQFINPALASHNAPDRDISNLVYASLMRYNAQGELVGDLAESYKVLEDGRKYLFRLRENLQWEDGTPLTTKDIVFTIQLIQDPRYGSPINQSWQGVEVSAENEREVTFKLSSTYVPFLENTTVGIIPSHIWQQIPPESFRLTDLNLQPIGSGPFKVEKFTKTKKGGVEFISSYTLERNERYWDKKPYLDKITFKFYTSEEEAIAAYNARSVDGMAFISASQIEKIKNPERLNMHEFQLPRYFAIFINQNKNDILKDSVIRSALGYAIDRDAIISEILNGFAQKAHTPIPPNLQTYYNNDIEILAYDPVLAAQILEDAGWVDTDGDGVRDITLAKNEKPLPLELTLTTLRWPELEKVALALRDQWKEVGIRVHIQFEELGVLQQDVIRPRSYELLLFGEIFGLVPDPFSFWHSSQKNHPGLNLSLYENNDVDKLLEDAREEFDEATRVDLYRQFQKQVVEDRAALFLYDPTYLYPVRKGVGGIKPTLLADPSLRFVDVVNWYLSTRRVF